MVSIMESAAMTMVLRRKNVAFFLTQRRVALSSSRSAAAPVNHTTKNAQQSAHAYYQRQREQSLWFRWFGRKHNTTPVGTLSQRNKNTAWYAAAVAIGALGATYAAVPLYKVFCQTTGFGGTTQRVQVEQRSGLSLTETLRQRLPQWMGGAGQSDGASSSRGARVHTWTDDEAAARLASLKPVENAELITVRFDTTVDDILPWSFVPVQLEVKVVPGETALSFFRVTNKSSKAITGVATYNVHPPKVGLYFSKIQCFCFEEQRLLPGETVDMPVFFFIDPDIMKDAQVSYVRSVTLSYFFHQTNEEEEDDDE